MTSLTTFLQATLQTGWAERMGWTLVHSLWQIGAVAGVYAVAALLLRHRTASTRYLVGCAALVAMLALPMATYTMLPTPSVPVTADQVPLAVSPAATLDSIPAAGGDTTAPAPLAIESNPEPLEPAPVQPVAKPKKTAVLCSPSIPTDTTCAPHVTSRQ